MLLKFCSQIENIKIEQLEDILFLIQVAMIISLNDFSNEGFFYFCRSISSIQFYVNIFHYRTIFPYYRSFHTKNIVGKIFKVVGDTKAGQLTFLFRKALITDSIFFFKPEMCSSYNCLI